MEVSERLERLEAQLKLVETYSVQAFWHALDRAYEALLPKIELCCIICGYHDGRSGFKVHTSKCQFGGGCRLNQRIAEIHNSAGKTIRQLPIGLNHPDVNRAGWAQSLHECTDIAGSRDDLPLAGEFR